MVSVHTLITVDAALVSEAISTNIGILRHLHAIKQGFFYAATKFPYLPRGFFRYTEGFAVFRNSNYQLLRNLIIKSIRQLDNFSIYKALD
jgi:hypothetical protein